MGGNARRNKAAIDQYRKELEAMVKDIKEIDKKILDKSLNVGLREVKRITPVKSGHMRENWFTNPVKESYDGVSKELFNIADYASYVNYGHRIVSNGKTKGFVKGRFILERAITKVDKAMVEEFKKAVEEVNRKHGK